MDAIEFNQWVNDNNIEQSHPYAKGWWDFVELVRLLAHHLGSDHQSVVGLLHITTPPPQTPMTLPVVRMEFGRIEATIAWFLPYEGFAPAYLVSLDGPCSAEKNGYQTFTASPNQLQWVMDKLADNADNHSLVDLFECSSKSCLFATNTEMDLYGALKCLTA